MKECIDMALNMCCDKTEFRPVMRFPFVWKDKVVASDGHYLLSVSGMDVMEYNNDDEKYGKRPNVDAIMKESYGTDGYLDMEDVKRIVEDKSTESVVVAGIKMKASNFRLLVKVAALLGIREWAVDATGTPLVMHTDDMRVVMLIMPWDMGGMTIDLKKKGYSYVDEAAAKLYYNVYKEEKRKKEEEKKRKHEEYMKGHHKIWKIYVKRTEVGVLLVDAPDEETAFKIAESEADEAIFNEDFDYEVEEDDYEEDVDHYEIQNDYSRESIATTEKTKWGYKFVGVNEYEYFDEGEEEDEDEL